MLFIQLPVDIIRLVHNELDFIGQKNLRLASHIFTAYPITNLLDNVPNLNKLTGKILKSYPFLTALNISHSYRMGRRENYRPAIININHLVNLKILNIEDCDKINNNGISLLTNLIELNVNNNRQITDINHLVKLRILHAWGVSGISDISISTLTNLAELNAENNNKIIHITHLINLLILTVAGHCGITGSEIMGLTNLIGLNANSNITITDVNHLTKLQILKADCTYGKCGINNIGISSLTNLTKLSVNNNSTITSINHLTKLQILYASGNCGISDGNTSSQWNRINLNAMYTNLSVGGNIALDDIYPNMNAEHIYTDGIKSLTNLTKLNVKNNMKITDIAHLINLRTLIASGDDCRIGNHSIKSLTGLTELNADFNKKITNVNHLVNLRILSASGYSCGIKNNGFKLLTNLTTIYLNFNKITDIDHIKKLQMSNTDVNSLMEKPDEEISPFMIILLVLMVILIIIIIVKYLRKK